MEPQITWYAQSAIRIDVAGLRLYIDPYHLPKGGPPADLILVSHEHADHLSLADVERVRDATTVVVASASAAPAIPGAVRVLAPDGALEMGDLRILGTPAYNVTKFRSPGTLYHPKSAANLGFLIEADDLTFYVAGDTDVIPEMDEVGPVDYAFLPVGGGAVMTAEEAAEATRRVRPSVAIPVHFGSGAGTVEDAERFAELVPDQVRVWILAPVGTP